MARPTESSDDPAAQSRSRDELPPQDESGKEANTLEQAQATLTLATAWLANLQSLAQLEFSRTLAAGKRILALQLLLLPLSLALILSLCGGAGLLGYYFSESIYVGFAVFVLVQVLIVAGILLYRRRLSAMLGFHETRRQAKEAVSDVFQSIK